MTDTLVTRVGAAMTNIVAMELLAVPDANAAVKSWLYINQFYPYWVNRCSVLTNPERHRWIMTVEAKLILAHIGAANKDDVSGLTPQENAWEYIPNTLRYFRQYKNLNAPTLTAVQNLDTDGVSIACPGGLRSLFNPYTGVSEIFISFDLTVPFLIIE